MGLSRIVLAWVVVTGWLVLWEAIGRQAGRGGGGPWLRAPAWHYAGEALLLTLFGALWFASLGPGGWWLVFALAGAIAQWPPAAERRARRRLPREVAGRVLGVLRIVVAGGLLAWRLSPA